MQLRRFFSLKNHYEPFEALSTINRATFVLLFSDCSNKILPHQQPIYATRVFQLKWDNDSVKLKFNPHRAITAYNYNLGYRIERDIRIYYNE